MSTRALQNSKVGIRLKRTDRAVQCICPNVVRQWDPGLCTNKSPGTAVDEDGLGQSGFSMTQWDSSIRLAMRTCHVFLAIPPKMRCRSDFVDPTFRANLALLTPRKSLHCDKFWHARRWKTRRIRAVPPGLTATWRQGLALGQPSARRAEFPHHSTRAPRWGVAGRGALPPSR
jgi:hypothetical protein